MIKDMVVICGRIQLINKVKMKLIKYINDNQEIIFANLIDEENFIVNDFLDNPFVSNILETKPDDIKIYKENLLPPCNPSKIVCFAINYEGITGFENKMSEPLVFLKSSNALCLNESIVKLPFNTNAWGEAEIGVVIKKVTKNIKIGDVKKNIFGYIIGNDVSCSNIENRDHHLARSKSADSFCPISNYIDLNFDPISKNIQSFHNDILLREGNSDQMFWSIDQLISWLSSWMTLYPQDIILTGSPGRVRDRLYLKKGDSFSCKVDGFTDLITYFD